MKSQGDACTIAPKKMIVAETLRNLKQAGDKIACLTAYDASFAALLEDSGIEVILVGDSLGMVVQGHRDTLSVTLDNMVYHTSCVARGAQYSLIVADLPFLSYTNPSQALKSAGRLMASGARMVKLEGGEEVAEIIAELCRWGIPVCAHLGLTPQSVYKLGGYRVQGRTAEQAEMILRSALALEEAGAELIVLECIPSELAKQVTRSLRIPTIGIGAGPHCDGQVLVSYDMLGATLGKPPRFSRDFLSQSQGIRDALGKFVAAVKSGEFPAHEHCY